MLTSNHFLLVITFLGSGKDLRQWQEVETLASFLQPTDCHWVSLSLHIGKLSLPAGALDHGFLGTY